LKFECAFKDIFVHEFNIISSIAISWHQRQISTLDDSCFELFGYVFEKEIYRMTEFLTENIFHFYGSFYLSFWWDIIDDGGVFFENF